MNILYIFSQYIKENHFLSELSRTSAFVKLYGDVFKSIHKKNEWNLQCLFAYAIIGGLQLIKILDGRERVVVALTSIRS